MSKMIPDPESYFRQFIPARDELLREIEQEAETLGIPIVGPVVGELLHILARATGAGRILELGAANGYSAVHLARACKPMGGKVLTLERDPGMASRALANLARAGLQHMVEVRVGDAVETLEGLTGPYDFIFMDIDKDGYLGALDHCRRLLRPGGMLVADNVGFSGADGFNRAVRHGSGLRAVHLFALLPLHSPEHDGLCLAVRT